MKKIITLALVGAMLSATGITAFAVDYPGGSQDTEIKTTVAPTFTVSIPADTTVAFNDLTTDFGSVTLDSARLAPNKAVQVTIESDFDLNNSVDNEAVIPYSLTATDGTDEETVDADYAATFRTAGEKTDLKINITQADWDAAAAGDYSDTVTFNIAYVDAAE
ncbi:MAG: hypothetical protein IJ861_07070 [Clostridia bacterium]|nr:hypothetical protein [Clostridia bacterium]